MNSCNEAAALRPLPTRGDSCPPSSILTSEFSGIGALANTPASVRVSWDVASGGMFWSRVSRRSSMKPISLCPVENATWVAKKAVPIYKTRKMHHRSFLLPRCTTHGPKIFGVWTLLKYQHALVRGGGGSRPSPPRGLHIIDSTWAQVEYILELYASRAHALGMDRDNAYILFPHPHRVWFSSRHGCSAYVFQALRRGRPHRPHLEW